MFQGSQRQIHYRWMCSCGSTVTASSNIDYTARAEFEKRVSSHVSKDCILKERIVDPGAIRETVLEFKSPVHCTSPISQLDWEPKQECGSTFYRIVKRGLELVVECRGCGESGEHFTDYMAAFNYPLRMWESRPMLGK